LSDKKPRIKLNIFSCLDDKLLIIRCILRALISRTNVL
jgi:hypothetical protein